jgi:hypothetical protein
LPARALAAAGYGTKFARGASRLRYNRAGFSQSGMAVEAVMVSKGSGFNEK